ncbi:MAG: hypothetical protein VKK04_19450 [Synechococcales bacterium]|nr:hypothetical protein [Synechococcales bacterium]
MSLRSLVQTLPSQFRQMTRQPGWWAVVSSVGFHGLLFVVLPLLPAPSSRASEPDIAGPVEVVELSPDQLARLPDFSGTEAIARPSIPDGEELYSFDEFDEFSAIAPDLPTASPIPAPFPGITTLPLPPRFPPTLPPQTIRDWLRQSPPLTPGPPLNELPTESPVTEPEVTPETPPVNTAEDLKPPLPDQAEGPDPADSAASTPTPAPEPSPEEIAQRRQEALLAEQQRLQEQFAFNPFGESQVEDAFSAFNTSAKGINATQGEPLTLALPYPSGACPLNFEEGQVIQAVWGAFVDGEKQVLGSPEPVLIYSSGYEFFDDIALEAVTSGAFTSLISGDATGNRAYIVTVEFAYSRDNCPPTSSPEAVGEAAPSPGDQVADSAPTQSSGQTPGEG